MIRRITTWMLAVVCALSAAHVIFLPLPQAIGGTEGVYLCIWENGAQTEESYDALYPYLESLSNEGDIVLLRDGVRGTVAAGETLRRAQALLSKGTLGEIVTLNMEGMSALERAAFYRTVQDVLLYDGEYLGWAEEKFAPVRPHAADELIWFSGELPEGALSDVVRLTVHSDAPLDADTLVGSTVTEISVQPPFYAEGGAIYLDTPGGRRFVSALPGILSLKVGDADFADEGALLACTALKELDLPFVGSAKSGVGTYYDGMFARLFLMDGEYFVPPSLAKVRVRGGRLSAYAFYRCADLLEIDACGVSADNIDADAFVSCTSLRLLHTPRANVNLSGTFTSSVAPCGCTVYERV